MSILFIWEHYFPEIWWLERSTERLAIWLQKHYSKKVIVLTSKFPWELNQATRNWVDIIRSGEFWKMSSEDVYRWIAQVREEYGEIEIMSMFWIWDNADERYWDAVFDDKSPSALKIWTSGDTKVKGIDIWALKRFDWHLCQNPWIEDELFQYWIERERIFSIRNGLDIDNWIDTSPSQDAAKKALWIPESTYVVSGIWRFVKRKNFDLLIDGYIDFSHKYKWSQKLLLLLQWSDFGQSDWVEFELKQKLKWLPDDSYKLLEANENTEIALSASDVFITLWDREGAPNIILEAQALWKPVIATDIPGHRVYINDFENGRLIKKEPTEVSNAIRDMNTIWFSPENIQKTARRFNINVTAKMYLDAYKRIINN